MSIFNEWADPNYWLGLLYAIPAVLLALSIHEAAHAYTAYKCGDPTARNLGRMTLDPLKHLDPIGTIFLLLFRFGWAKPVPVNSRNFKHVRKDNILVSISGILANFILSFIAAAVLFVSMVICYNNGWEINAVYVRVLMPVIYLDLTLGLFNLIPIPPLDGFQLIGSLLPKGSAKVVNVLYRYGFIILLVLVFTGFTGFLLNGFMSLMFNAYDSFFSLFDPSMKDWLWYAYAMTV